MRKLTPQQMEALGRLNEHLAGIEQRILKLGLEFEAEILALEPHDWELEVTYEYTLGDESRVSWFEPLKFVLEDRRKGKERWGLADGEDHNVSSVLVSGLDRQRHCYLMHQLYDDFLLPWDESLSLEWMWLDFELRTQFEFDLRKDRKRPDLERRLSEILMRSSNTRHFMSLRTLIFKVFRCRLINAPLNKYGRLLAYIWVGDKMLNKELLREGLAVLLTIPQVSAMSNSSKRPKKKHGRRKKVSGPRRA